MKLFLISQDENQYYDTYDSAVVCAPDELTAQHMNPSSGQPMTPKEWTRLHSSWASEPDHVTVRYLGEATDGVEQGIVCASFNAG